MKWLASFSCLIVWGLAAITNKRAVTLLKSFEDGFPPDVLEGPFGQQFVSMGNAKCLYDNYVSDNPSPNAEQKKIIALYQRFLLLQRVLWFRALFECSKWVISCWVIAILLM